MSGEANFIEAVMKDSIEASNENSEAPPSEDLDPDPQP